MSVVVSTPSRNTTRDVLDAKEAACPGARAECIDGVFTLNQPTPLHQSTVLQLAMALSSQIPAGYRVLTEVRVKDDDTWITPDVLVVTESVALSDKNPLDPSDIFLMCEVLSPSTERKDRTEKRVFASAHQIDYWVVSPGDPWGTIEVMPYRGEFVTPPDVPPRA